MSSVSKRWFITYNGEVYNFEALRSELAQADPSLDLPSDGDTAVLVAALEAWGIHETLRRIRGIFAFAAYDAHASRLYLVRDRMGVKPLFYGEGGERLVFASRADVVGSEISTGATGTGSRSSLAEWTCYGYVSGASTIFSQVYQVPPGAVVEVSTQGAKSYPYVVPERRQQVGGGRVDAFNSCERLQRELTDAVRSQLVSDAPVGLFLSGGVDSTLIAALAAKHAASRLSSFTVRIEGLASEDADAARSVANELGLRHHEVMCTQADLARMFDHALDSMDQPIADPSILPTLLVSEAASNHVKVVLTGDGGDELLGGYSRHRWAGAVALAARARIATVPGYEAITNYTARVKRGGDILGRLLGEMEGHRKAARIFRGLSVTHSGGSLYDACTVVEPNSGVLLGSAALASGFAGVRRWNPPVDRPTGGRGWAEYIMECDEQVFLPSSVLTKVDRATMAYGLEARVPLLSEGVVAAAKELTYRQCSANGQSKWPLRLALRRQGNHQIAQVAERPKSGFHVGYAELASSCLKVYGEALLGDDAIARVGVLDPCSVRMELMKWRNGDASTSHRLWIALVIQGWCLRRGLDAWDP